MTVQPHRVVQWATGNIGTRSLRAVIEHPDLTLVGVWVHSSDKAGRDAGDLCGTGQTGVRATNSLDDVLAAAPHCVLYMPSQTNLDELCALLEAGVNVVTTRGDFHRPASMEAAARERVEDACALGNTSIHSTGSSPGFISEALPFVLTSIQRRLDSFIIDEFADLSKRNSPELLFDLMGYGRDPAVFDERRWQHGALSFGPSMHLVADAIGLPLDTVDATGEVAVARTTVEIAAGTIREGTVAAQRMIVSGIRKGRPLLMFRAHWYCTRDIEPAWDLGDTGWRVSVQGDAPLEIEMPFNVPLERMGETSPGYTAHRAVNAVPYVCAAPAGIRTTVDLPQIIARLSD